MGRPGVEFRERDAAPPRTLPTDTGVWFVVGQSAQGLVEPTRINSFTKFTQVFGGRVSYSILSDSMETFFREGGGVAYIARLVGPAAVAASANLFDAAGVVDPDDISLVVDAISPGDWGDALNVIVDDNVSLPAIPAGSFRVTVTHDDDGILEISPDLADRDAAVSWALGSDYIRFTLGPSAEDPRAVASPGTSLAGGDDDRENITDTEYETALDLFSKTLGPGQVSFPGETTTELHTILLAHTASHNRVALLDAPDSDQVATLTASAEALATAENASRGAMYGPAALVPGLIVGTTRQVPYSAIQAAVFARNDATGNPNLSGAGRHGIASWALSTKYNFTDAQYETLNESGVNMARMIAGQMRTYGARSLTPDLASTLWWQFHHSRLRMAIQARSEAIGENFMFDQVDGRGVNLGQLAGQLASMLTEYVEIGALYTDPPPDDVPSSAFSVNVGPEVNPPAQVQAGEIHAVESVRMSPSGEWIIIELVRVPITEPV